MIEVVATVNLPGLRQGQHALVDPDTPYVANCLRHGFVVVHQQPQAQYEPDHDTVDESRGDK